eukprot:SAG31_NODE_5202_length_2678_cov_30.889492_2_plen_353_part_00
MKTSCVRNTPQPNRTHPINKASCCVPSAGLLLFCTVCGLQVDRGGRQSFSLNAQHSQSKQVSNASFSFTYQPQLEPPVRPNLFEAIKLNRDQYPLASCLDGSSYVFYFRAATNPGAARKWSFHIQGGGWCPNVEDCAERALTYLGSSVSGCIGCSNTSWQDMELMQGCEGNRWCGPLISASEAVNPLAHDWNAVVLRYCDGSSFLGSSTSPLEHDGKNLFSRGRYNLEGAFSHLIRAKGLGNASTVIVGGDSAGGLATYLNIDRIADWIHQANQFNGLPDAHIVGVPDSGFWPDDPELHWIGDRSFSSDFKGMYHLHGGPLPALPKHCKWQGSDPTKCLHPQYFAEEIETQL